MAESVKMGWLLDLFNRAILSLGYAVNWQTYSQARQTTLMDHGIGVLTWATMEDPTVCDYCDWMNGMEFTIDDAPTLPAHVNCRCRLVAKPI